MAPTAIRKQDILEVSYFNYKGYEQETHVPEKFKILDVMAKLRDKNKKPNLKNIIEDVTLIFPYNKEFFKEDDGWIKMRVVVK